MVSLDDVMLKFSRQFSQESECSGIWWFPRKDYHIRFLDNATSYEKLCKKFHLNVSMKCFFQGISVFSNLKS